MESEGLEGRNHPRRAEKKPLVPVGGCGKNHRASVKKQKSFPTCISVARVSCKRVKDTESPEEAIQEVLTCRTESLRLLLFLTRQASLGSVPRACDGSAAMLQPV